MKFHLQPITAEGLQRLSNRQHAEKVARSSTSSHKLRSRWVCLRKWIQPGWHGPTMSPVGISLPLTLAADAFLQTWKAGQQPSAHWPPAIQKASISPPVCYVFCLCENPVRPRNKLSTKMSDIAGFWWVIWGHFNLIGLDLHWMWQWRRNAHIPKFDVCRQLDTVPTLTDLWPDKTFLHQINPSSYNLRCWLIDDYLFSCSLQRTRPNLRCQN